MAATLFAGAPPKQPRAYRQVRDPETGRWRTAARNDKRTKIDRWRAQASVRLWTGEVVKRDATAKTKDAAERRLVGVLQALLDESNPARQRTDFSVEQVVRLWLEAPERHDVAASSLSVYESSARRWLVPAALPRVAKLKIRQVEPRDVSGWLLTVAATAGIPTARTARSVLSTVFRYAIAQAHASSNPVRDATTPSQRVVEAERARLRVRQPTKRPGPGANLDHSRAFSKAEVERLLEAACSTPERRGDDLVDLLAFLDGTAVRLGAALATLWDDLDLEGDGWAAGTDLDPRRAWFQTGVHTITRVAGVGLVRSEYGSTKRSLRRLALPQDLTERLRERRVRSPLTAYLVPNPLDTTQPREVSFVTKRVRRLCDSCVGDDGEPMTWASSHTFRRTLVTDAHDAGAPDRHIAGQTGHGRIKVLQDHYIARVPASTVAADLRDRTPRFASVADQESDSESDPAAPRG